MALGQRSDDAHLAASANSAVDTKRLRHRTSSAWTTVPRTQYAERILLWVDLPALDLAASDHLFRRHSFETPESPRIVRMRYRLRTLHLFIGIGPPVIAGTWFLLCWFVRKVPFGAWPLWIMAALSIIGLLIYATQNPKSQLTFNTRRHPSRWLKYRRRQRALH